MALTTQIPEGSRMIVNVRGRSVGVFNIGGTFRALLNRCPHQGGPLCLGPVIPLIESDAPGAGVRFDDERPMIQCPWHHWEFDLETGQSYVSPRGMRVRSYPISVESGDRVADDMRDGTSTRDHVETQPVQPQSPVYAGGCPPAPAGSGRVPGPYTAETLAVTVEDDYVVLHLS